LIVLVDIDHTLSDAAWRDHLVPMARATGDWSAYYAAMDEDDPIMFVVTLVRLLSQSYTVVGMTGRPETYRAKTLVWLRRNNVELFDVLMRPDGDRSSSPKLKVTMIRKKFPLDSIAFAIEDRDDCIAALRAIGIPVFKPMMEWNGSEEAEESAGQAQGSRRRVPRAK